ncbi:RNA binding protein [Arabidopsis lyrata subsp. lyrata]|uniref:RNA binding protein n=1 Tax=Arabidopsis lyrata subsp. lyrata TaxID=81972 RepID=D7LD23_ARALL|nr:regulator of nonsense transcripts UPF2 isoform X1 [Arabidopsis lyrata subsp. lyrata]EFH57899.1 RNA binding protein [Arabidopsis lyrata subsp. lyrata]|eukprot:XP_002881640.1 regulator of nonsense transcripts UPF2 isoform X1 [Arabidopsis lyrata subsp. lyrata]
MDHPEDETHSEKQDDEEALARLEEIKKSVEAKMTLRQNNLNPERPDSTYLRTLDSSIKRNTAVIKKLKQINEEQREGLMDDLRGVNLSKFVSEAVTAICEAKLKSSDIQAAVQICSLLHQRYKEFSPSLTQGLLKVFFPGKSAEDLDADKNSKAMKKRSTLKLLLELYYVGVIEDSNIFINIIKDLTSVEQLKDRDTTQTNLTLLASFARQGRVFLGLPISGQDEDFFKGLDVSADQKKSFKKAFNTYYDALADLLQSEHKLLLQMEKENAKLVNAKGELSEDSASSYEKLRKSYDHLYRNISSLAESLDMQPPVMPEDGTTRLTAGDEASPSGAVKDTSVPEPIWDDEDTKTFYECLPDLRAFVPAVLLGEAEPKSNEQSAKAKDKSSESSSEVVENQQTTEDTTEVSADSGSMADGSNAEQPKEKEEVEKEKAKDARKEKGKEKDGDKKMENEKEKGKSLDVANFERLLQRLPGCVSRDLIDQLTVEYCYLNSKTNRKKLVKALFNVPRTSLELLAYYSRMVATLASCMKDIPSMLVQMLEDEFNSLVHKKDQMNIETKIRNIRFIGELCKFKIVPAGLVFSCLKACLDEFTHHNIDVACNLLETCGRFLYRSPETTLRMTNMLDILMRLKNVKNLDPRQSTLVENAYYLCKPPERSARISKVRPPLHQYIRKLLFSDLDKDSIANVLKQLRKLPWSECEQYILKCFMKVHKGKYGQIHLIASLTSGLSRHHDEFAVAVVDEVLEEIRVGLELNEYGAQQKRLAHMRFLGELYNYEHVDSSVIFETLYLTLLYGHDTSEQEVLDPPEDFFRIRMVIILLETCGHYFDRGSSKKRLDQFLIHFQRYILSKGHLPLDIEFDLQDLFANLRPNMTRYATIDEVNAAILQLEEREHASSGDKVSIERHSDTKPSNRPSSDVISSNGKSTAKDIRENGEAHGEESDSDSGSGSVVRDGQNEELDDGNHERGSESGDGDDFDDGDGPGSDDDKFRVRQKVVTVDPEEQADFDQELKALLQESMEQRKLELRGRPALNMTIPMSVFEGSGKDHHHFGRVVGENGEDLLDEENGEQREVQVKVLVKRGNKQQTRQMLIPSDCSLVQSTKQKEAAELEEKQDIKRLVLEYNERDEEEANALGTQILNWTSGGSRGSTRTGEGSGKSGGSRHRFYYHQGGGGSYHARRK